MSNIRLVGLAMLWAFAPTASADIVLVRNGRPCARIVIGGHPSRQARDAAAELREYVRRMTGAELPIAERAGSGGIDVFVGQAAGREVAARLGVQIPSGLTSNFDDEGYVMVVKGRSVLLAGNETEPYQGTCFAVSDFLESLGCRWYFPGAFGEVVPRRGTLAVSPCRRVRRPDLRVRDTWYSGHLRTTPRQQAEFRTWKRRNRMCRGDFWYNCTQPAARFLQNPVDNSTYRLLPKDKYWAGHRDYYAMTPGGGRNDRFICMSDSGALDAAVDTIVQYFHHHPDHHAFAFSPPDEPVLCHCSPCTRAMHGGYGGEGHGQVSDAYFSFVFRLADKVRERLPDRWITTMAYYNRCRPPEGIEGKRKNLLIQLASIQQCSLHSYAQEACPSRREFAAMLRRWAELTAGQVFYEYDPHDWSHSQRPAWRSRGIADDLRLLKSLGGWGFSDEGQMAWLSTGLNYYVRAHLAWDLKQDPAVLVQDFCNRFFGPAAEPMYAYYTTLEKAIRETKVHAPGGAPEDLFAVFTQPCLDRCARRLHEAGRRAEHEPFKSRVAAFRGQFDRLDAYRKARAAMARGQYRAAERWALRMKACVARVGNTMLLQDAGPWGGACSGAGVAAFAGRIAPWTDRTKGRVLAVLPPVARFRPDPASQGLVYRWYLPGLETTNWRELRMTSAWHNQGVLTPEGRRYEGVAWYRTHVALPRAPTGTVRLLFPEAKASALWVWCNGTLAGMAEEDSDGLLNVDVSGRVRSGDNLFALRVQGKGGLTLPPLLCVPASPAGSPDRSVEISVFPSEWLFHTDPQRRGVHEGWHLPGFQEAGWRSLPVTSFWDDALGRYTGEAWYRVHFTVPQSAKGKHLTLRFGAVDEEAWVYLNGKLLGEHTTASTGKSIHRIWDKPFDVPVRGARFGEDNVLAVRVRNAVAAGGIFKPVRLMARP